jgi:hypothetical protein
VNEDERRRAKAAPRRVIVRLKHSLAADEEINAVMPDTLEEFDEALARGELRELKAGLDDVLGESKRRKGGPENKAKEAK